MLIAVSRSWLGTPCRSVRACRRPPRPADERRRCRRAYPTASMATSSTPRRPGRAARNRRNPSHRRASRASSASAGVRPRSSHPALNVTLTWASASRSTAETWQRRPSTSVPAPRTAPPGAERRGGDGGDDDVPVRVDVGERGERRPYRDPADEHGGPVDRVDDPLPGTTLAESPCSRRTLRGRTLGEHRSAIASSAWRGPPR